jgi:DNA-directed RNA polymerase subunit RPC12/RpoP
MTNQNKIKCSDCGGEIIEPDTEDSAKPQPCPTCGSCARTVMFSVSDEIPVQLKERLRATVKNASYKSKDKLRRDLVTGDELHQKTGKSIIKQREINKIKIRIWKRSRTLTRAKSFIVAKNH